MDPRFTSALSGKNFVFIIGTGVSAAATNGAIFATWRGLIEDGIGRLESMGAKAAWARQIRGNLDYAFAEDDMNMILASASAVAKEFALHPPYAYSKWLAETVGALTPIDETLTKKIRALPFPILTTNYDLLLGNNDRRATDWTRVGEMQRVMSGESKDIGHLHGVWNNPESVVFSERKYDELLQSDAAQALQHSISSLKCLVYIGFGAGISDPNFSKLIDWHRSKFIPSGVNHFRLCLASELSGLQAFHAADHIIPVSYGDNHDDLPGFLDAFHSLRESTSLSTVGIVRDTIGETQTDFAEEMKTEAILSDVIAGIELRPLSDVVIPPVLLPVPHSEYIKARAKTKASDNIDRIDPLEDVKGGDIIVIAAEENSGLTTAIKWMTLEAARYITGAAPIYVPFHACKKLANPLMSQVQMEAYRRQLISKRSDPLPPMVLGVDDFSPYVGHISEAVIQEIAESEALLTIVGCTQGVEDEVVDRLQRLGSNARVRYLGKLSAADVREYARRVSPSDVDALSSQVLAMLRAENLARTPFTVSLLISVLMQGGKFSANASQTSILDDYVGLLLGRGDPHEDARFELDQSARQAILSGLAQAFVEAGAGGLPEPDVHSSFQKTFDKFGWVESTSEVLSSFLERRILRRKDKFIEFSRSSFLHIFAAKRATLDANFRSLLLERPVYYSSALTDYAALYRHDADLLSRLAELLEKEYLTSTDQGIFAALELAEPNLHSEDDDEGEGEYDGTPDKHDTSRSDAAEEPRQIEKQGWDDEFFDWESDEDRPPFPTAHEDDVPRSLQLFRTLELVSAVLRDSDQVEDLDLKTRVLSEVLDRWGTAMILMHEDTAFHDFLRTLILDAELVEPDSPDESELLTELGKAIPAAMTLGAVGETLASRKLIMILERLTSRGDFASAEGRVVLASFFWFSLGEPGWPSKVSGLLEGQDNIWVIRNFLLHLFTRAFIWDEVVIPDQDALLELCVTIVQRSSHYNSERESRQHEIEIAEDLKRARLKRRVARKYSGERSIERP